MGIPTIEAARLGELMKAGEALDLLDVRTPAEFREVHVKGAQLVPLDRLEPATVMSSRPGDAPIYVLCRSGARAKKACEALTAAGHGERVVLVEGGTQACVAAGLPVVRGKKSISLERQVRIAAGSLVMIGTALGAFVHPYFLGLAAFVGAGLVFAGVTDTCGMGMLLARMPWNRAPEVDAKPTAGCAVG